MQFISLSKGRVCVPFKVVSEPFERESRQTAGSDFVIFNTYTEEKKIFIQEDGIGEGPLLLYHAGFPTFDNVFVRNLSHKVGFTRKVFFVRGITTVLIEIIKDLVFTFHQKS